MKKYRNKTLNKIERQVNKQKENSRMLSTEDFQKLASNSDKYHEDRHIFICKYDSKINANYNKAFREAESLISSKLSIPLTKHENVISKNSEEYYHNLAFSMGLEKNEALKASKEMYKIDLAQQRFNSCYKELTNLSNNVNDSYNTYINPYEAQLLFETTSLGYSGVVLPILEAFSTTLSIHNPFLAVEDIDGITKYLIEKDIINVIKMGIIDAYVYGGGVITPIFQDKNGNKKFFKDLISIDEIYNNKWKLWDTMVFDRYCTMPYLENDGFYFNILRTYNPKIPLLTIFGNGNDDLLSYEWSARFSLLTTSLCRTIRPDGFGSSIFARAGQAVYNYTTQLKFLQYALSQLSIIVFNTNSDDYERGGADYSWNQSLGGNNIQQIQQQLSQMQQGMNVEKGIFLNGITATTLNRTFTGIDSIINAVKGQASNAFNVRQELLFGDQKSSLGNTAGIKDTPKQYFLREQFRHSILKIVQWCVLGYFADRDYCMYNGDRLNLAILKKVLLNTSLIYNDSVKSNEDILKEYGADVIYKLVESRLMSIDSAIKYIASIPILSKVYNSETDDFKSFVNKITSLQNKGLEAEISELEFIEAVNKDALNNNTAIMPDSIDNLNKTNNNLGYILKRDANGRPVPMSIMDNNITKQEPTQKFRKRKSHE